MCRLGVVDSDWFSVGKRIVNRRARVVSELSGGEELDEAFAKLLKRFGVLRLAGLLRDTAAVRRRRGTRVGRDRRSRGTGASPCLFRGCCGRVVNAAIAEHRRAGGISVNESVGKEEGFAELIELGGGEAGAGFPEEACGEVEGFLFERGVHLFHDVGRHRIETAADVGEQFG